jgi:hypothetical protein
VERRVARFAARYGYEVPDNATAQQKRDYRVSDAFPPALWDGVADVETMAIAEALLEKYGQGYPPVSPGFLDFSIVCLRLILSSISINL